MTMKPGHDELRSDFIAALVDDLQPLAPIRPPQAWFWIGLAVIATITALAVVKGLWAGPTTGDASAYWFIVHGLLLVLGLAAAANVVTMASPRVGNSYSGAKWASLMVGVLPLAALASLTGAANIPAGLIDSLGVICAAAATLSSLLTGAVLILWLRRGAPVSLQAAGWQTGVAAGGLGTAVYALGCPVDDIVHLGIYHVIPVAIMALLGAAIVPRLVRW